MNGCQLAERAAMIPNRQAVLLLDRDSASVFNGGRAASESKWTRHVVDSKTTGTAKRHAGEFALQSSLSLYSTHIWAVLDGPAVSLLYPLIKQRV